jgi:hypothetical protein
MVHVLCFSLSFLQDERDGGNSAHFTVSQLAKQEELSEAEQSHLQHMQDIVLTVKQGRFKLCFSQWNEKTEQKADDQSCVAKKTKNEWKHGDRV